MARRRRRRSRHLRAADDVRRRRQEVDLAEGQVDERWQPTRHGDAGGGLPERMLLQVNTSISFSLRKMDLSNLIVSTATRDVLLPLNYF